MSYPQSIKQFISKIDKNASGFYIGPEYFNVPSSTPFEIYLDHVPKDSASTQIGASGGSAWTEIFSGTPGGNQYLIDYDFGKVTFASSDSDAQVQATYLNLGDDIMAEHINGVQDEIVTIESTLGEGVTYGYASLKEKLDSMDASGINGQRIIDNTIRAGALMSDIKGSNWAADGRPVLTDIVDHENSSSAHAAASITINQPIGVTADNVQDHIESIGRGTRSDVNPHGMSMYDIDQGILPGSLGVETISAHLVAASGNIMPISSSAVGTSGMYDVGSRDFTWASGNFDALRSQNFYAGSYQGVDGSFTAGANTVTVRKGLIVSIL